MPRCELSLHVRVARRYLDCVSPASFQKHPIIPDIHSLLRWALGDCLRPEAYSAEEARWVRTMDTSARTQDSSPLSISTIGEDLTITGNVTSKGKLHLNGQVQGDVHCVALVLGENAQLEGNVVADDVMVRGRLIGSVRALNVTLESKSHVEGNVFHKSLSIERDTHFEGESHPSGDPLASSRESPIVSAHKDSSGPSDATRPQARAQGFIRSLPESRSA
jgi:cytoskeletal protein CcmA (bactofilin family)